MIRKPPLCQKELLRVRDRLTEHAARIGAVPQVLFDVFDAAWNGSSLDSHAILSRIIWLTTPQEKTGEPLLSLKGVSPDAAAHEFEMLARALKRTENWTAVTLFRIREILRDCMAAGGAL